MNYYQDLAPWTLNGEKVMVTEDNDHLGQIVSGIDQEQKNIDLRMQKARNALYGLTGPVFSHKNLISPKLKYHLFHTYVLPVLKCGLSSFVLRKSHLNSLTTFHRKALRTILSLNKCSNIPALHCLLGELPIEGQIHNDVLSLFYNVWANPETKVHHIVKQLLGTSAQNSRTWAVHLKFLCKFYGLEDPLKCLNSDPPKKSHFKEIVKTKITIHFEKLLREMAANNSHMIYLNVSLLSLRGKPHPALSNILTSHEVEKYRPHIKMLSGNYLTYEVKSSQSGGSPHCRACSANSEDILHILTQCTAYKDIRNRIVNQMKSLLEEDNLLTSFAKIFETENHLCQFILDPTSLNLPIRVSQSDPISEQLFKLSRDFCFAVHKSRWKILQEKNDS